MEIFGPVTRIPTTKIIIILIIIIIIITMVMTIKIVTTRVVVTLKLVLVMVILIVRTVFSFFRVLAWHGVPGLRLASIAQPLFSLHCIHLDFRSHRKVSKLQELYAETGLVARWRRKSKGNRTTAHLATKSRSSAA